MKKWILFLIFLGITANAAYFMSQPDDRTGTREFPGCSFPTGACG